MTMVEIDTCHRCKRTITIPRGESMHVAIHPTNPSLSFAVCPRCCARIEGLWSTIKYYGRRLRP